MTLHVRGVSDLDGIIENVFHQMHTVRKGGTFETRFPLAGRQMIGLFFQPSTRTRISFKTAMHQLGGHAFFENPTTLKEETFDDRIRTLSRYADVLVLRSAEAGIPARAAALTGRPVVNAGDGPNEHPTQSIGDVFTMVQSYSDGRLGDDGINLCFYGDNAHSRTVRSTSKFIALFKKKLRLPIKSISYIGAPGLGLPPPDVLEALKTAGIPILIKWESGPRALSHLLDMGLRDINVVSFIRLQAEYAGVTFKLPPLTPMELTGAMGKKSIFLHSLPRGSELPTNIDADPRALYFDEQLDNVLLGRKILLPKILRVT